ncbi:MAG TPA: MBL fold metallo-hydrolase, partial [Bacillota bacterium]|nr:MBL fold metallo-hydrolase [Bacillota bacterium]
QPAEADPEPDLTEPETTQNPEIPSARFGELHVISEEDLPADKDRDFWLYGFQEKTESGSMTLRVVSLYGTDEYDTAGIKVSFAAGGPSDEQETQGELVSEINSGNGSLSATKLGGQGFCVTELPGLPAEGAVVMTLLPFGVKGGTVSYSDTYTALWYDSQFCGYYKGSDVFGFENAYDCAYGCVMTIVEGANEGIFRACAGVFVSEGYELVSQTEAAGNLFATVTGSTYSVSLAYIEYNNELRIMREPVGNTEPELLKKTETEKTCQPLLLQVGVVSYDDSVTNGTCYMFRLSDGSFLIIDGGSKEDFVTVGPKMVYRQNAQRIYALLKEYAPDPNNIRIAGWIITHYHEDHYGALQRFAELYSGDKTLSIERFLFNYSSQGPKADAAMAAFPGAKQVQVHPGQHLYVRDAEIEILYTHELYTPREISNLNTESVVFRVTLGGQTLLMTADMSEEANQVIRDMYGNYLKSDFVAVAHHGWVGGNTEFYTLVKPEYALWPVGLNGYFGVKTYYVSKENLSSLERNEYFLPDNSDTMFRSGETVKVEYSEANYEKKGMRALYVAGFSTWVFKLPFYGTNYSVTENVQIN